MICPESGKEVSKGSLVVHHQTQHGVTKGRLGQEGDEVAEGKNIRTYGMMFIIKAVPRPCPFEGCSVQASTQTEMMVQFWHRHVRDTVLILEEGNLPHPQFPLCDMLVPWKDLHEMYRRTEKCTWV